MGNKVNPIAHRLGAIFDWQSRWFSGRNYKETLAEDILIRKSVMEKLKNSGIARCEIERSINSIKLYLHVSKPGMVIGRGGAGIEELKKYMTDLIRSYRMKHMPKSPQPKIDLRIEPVKEPNLDAMLVAKNVSDQLARRLPFKRVLVQNAERVMASGAKGVKIALSGRIAGAEIARREKIHLGTVPLSTIREQVTYASIPSLTKRGYIGVKVWINLGEK
jgi:small subunit ribosomal protein S3